LRKAYQGEEGQDVDLFREGPVLTKTRISDHKGRETLEKEEAGGRVERIPEVK